MAAAAAGRDRGVTNAWDSDAASAWDADAAHASCSSGIKAPARSCFLRALGAVWPRPHEIGRDALLPTPAVGNSFHPQSLVASWRVAVPPHAEGARDSDACG
jgi:hypothetical protein